MRALTKRMKRAVTILIPASLLAWGGLVLYGQYETPATPPAVPTGIISGQAVGRVILDSNLNTEVLMYYPSIAGVGSNLFNGTPSAKTAFFSARSNKFKGTALVNLNVGVLALSPDSDQIVMNVYFNPNPDRDFSKPETFSDGQLVGSYPVSTGSTTLVDGVSASFVYSAQIESSNDFVFRDKTYNGRTILPGFSVFLHGAAPTFSISLSNGSGFVIPMAGVMIASDRKQ